MGRQGGDGVRRRRARPQKDRRFEVRVFGTSFYGGRWRQASLRAALWRARKELADRRAGARLRGEDVGDLKAAVVNERNGRVWRVA